MKRLLVLLGLAPLVWITAAQAQRMSDEEVRSRIVNDYVGGFRAGDCPCPYSYAWNGQQCADKSIYSQRSAPAATSSAIPPTCRGRRSASIAAASTSRASAGPGQLGTA